MSDTNPLVQRVDALLKRHQQQGRLDEPVAVPADKQEVADPMPADASALDAATALAPETDVARFEPPDADAIPVYSPPAQPDGLEDDIPVLTEIVEPEAIPGAGAATPGKAVVEEIEAAVIGKVLAELDRSLDARLNRTIAEIVEQSMDGLRADLAEQVRRVVHEAVSSALAKHDPDGTGSS